MKFFLRSLFVIIVLMIAVQIYLPGMTSAAVEQALYKRYGFQDIEVEVHSLPAVNILAGKIGQLRINVPEAVFNNMTVSDVEIVLHGLSINLFKVYRGEIDYSLAQRGELEFEITEQSMNDYLSGKPVNGFKEILIELNADKSIIKSQIVLLGKDISFDVAGNFAIEDGNMVFIPDNLIIQEYSVGEVFQDKVKGNLNFQIELGDLPYNTRLTGLEVLDDSIRVTGEIG